MNERVWMARRNAVLAAAIERARDAAAVEDLDFPLTCQVQVSVRFVDRVVEEGSCTRLASWWIECRACGKYRLSCEDHATRTAALTPVFCVVCRSEKPTAKELFAIAPLPTGV